MSSPRLPDASAGYAAEESGSPFARYLRSAKRLAEFFWYIRSRWGPLNIPFPCRLPYGAWFLAYGDAMGARVFGYRWAGHPYEEGEWKLVSRFLQPGMTCIDVGANQGFYTMLAARRVGKEGMVYAFEPAPTEARKLRTNLRINGCANVRVEEQALGSSEGQTPFYLCRGHQGSWSSLRRPADDVTAPMAVIQVPITTLDAYASRCRISSIHLVKIDVEGGELDVLTGGESMIRNQRPVILCEIASSRTRQWGYPTSSIQEYLEGFGYQWYCVARDGRLRSISVEEEGGWNLAAVPADRTDILKMFSQT